MDGNVMSEDLPAARVSRRIAWVAAALLATLSVLAGSASANNYSPSGTIVAESNFRPDANGYSFPNYGNEASPQNLDAAGLQKLFGSGVCMGGDAGNCTLKPGAQAWLEAQNKSMGGGHCEGFAVTASLFYAGLGDPPDPSPFGADTVPGLALDGNTALQAQIAYGYVFQALPSISTAKVNGSPNEVLAALATGLPSHEPMVLGVYKRGFVGGHAITPLSIEDRGAGKVAILVYDNNFPNTIREVDVDTSADTWNYTASTNPSEEAALYEGDASTKTLEIEYARNGLSTQPCPFCGGGAQAAKAPAQTAKAPARRRAAGDAAPAELLIKEDALNGEHANVSITDADGNTTGCSGTGDDRVCSSDIPGVELVPIKAGGVDVWKESPSPLFDVPQGLAFNVDFNAEGLASPADEGFSLVRDGVTFSMKDLHLTDGDDQQVKIDDKSLEMANGSDHKIDPTLAFDDVTAHNGYEVAVRTSSFDPGSDLQLSLKPGKRSIELQLDSNGNDDVKVSTLVTRTEADGSVNTARSRSATIEDGQTGKLSYGDEAMKDGKLDLDTGARKGHVSGGKGHHHR